MFLESYHSLMIKDQHPEGRHSFKIVLYGSEKLLNKIWFAGTTITQLLTLVIFFMIMCTTTNEKNCIPDKFFLKIMQEIRNTFKIQQKR